MNGETTKAVVLVTQISKPTLHLPNQCLIQTNDMFSKIDWNAPFRDYSRQFNWGNQILYGSKLCHLYETT